MGVYSDVNFNVKNQIEYFYNILLELGGGGSLLTIS